MATLTILRIPKFIVRLATSKSRQSIKKNFKARNSVESAIGYRP